MSLYNTHNPDLTLCPIGGKIKVSVPYTGSYLITKINDDEYLDEFNEKWGQKDISESQEFHWQSWGDDWQGNVINWEKETSQLKSSIQEALAVLTGIDKDANAINVTRILKEALDQSR